jgi:hypothetical protein
MERMSRSVITRQMLQYLLKVKSTQYINEKIHFFKIMLSKNVKNLEHLYSKINFAINFLADHSTL